MASYNNYEPASGQAPNGEQQYYGAQSSAQLAPGGYEMHEPAGGGPPSPYGSGDAFQYANAGSGEGFAARRQKAWYLSKWIKIGLPVAVLVAIGAILGGVLGSRAADDDDDSNTDSSKKSSPSATKTSNNPNVGLFATSLNHWTVPVYPSETNTAAFVAPTIRPTSTSGLPTLPSCTSNPFTPTQTGSIEVTTERPRVFGAKSRWDCLPDLIAADDYLKSWNDTIMANATYWHDRAAPQYIPDGGLDGSGVLDQAREIQLAIKHFAYAWRMTNDEKWKTETWNRLRIAAGNDTDNVYGQSGNKDGDVWNANLHFLDAAEFMNAFAIAYDWMYDAWDNDRKEQIKWSIINLGLNRVQNDMWWRGTYNPVTGNWNCVCNGGIINAAIAIYEDDSSGAASSKLQDAIQNANEQCVNSVHQDGTWVETANYWYFGTSGHAQAVMTLITATGSDQGLITTNPEFGLTALFHMHVFGQTQLFNYGDHGPNKFTATANALLVYGNQYSEPHYGLYQRDRSDVAEPNAMLWYNQTQYGAWFNDLPIDHHFNDTRGAWAAMRSSWTDPNGLYIAMKAGNMTGHQTHGDVDYGDFVIDALGERWAGELGSADYLGDGYFSNETQGSNRWRWYRKRTEGQNTLLLNTENANVLAEPATNFDSTYDTHGPSTVIDLPDNTAAYFWTNLASAYNDTSIARGIRPINKRRQVLLQDEITLPSGTLQWRMHTNATVSIDGSTATLLYPGSGAKMEIKILSPDNLSFGQTDAVRLESDPPLPDGGTGLNADIPNTDANGKNTTVLTIDLPAQSDAYTLMVLFNPQWDDLSESDYVTPKTVALADWSLTSH